MTGTPFHEQHNWLIKQENCNLSTKLNCSWRDENQSTSSPLLAVHIRLFRWIIPIQQVQTTEKYRLSNDIIQAWDEAAYKFGLDKVQNNANNRDFLFEDVCPMLPEQSPVHKMMPVYNILPPAGQGLVAQPLPQVASSVLIQGSSIS